MEQKIASAVIKQYEPLVDNAKLSHEVSEYILSCGYFTEYKKTAEFEAELARILNVKYCSVVNNGTISLVLALKAMGVEPGDKVLIPNLTMYATQAAVELIGAVPVLIDIDAYTLCMDLKIAEEYIKNNDVNALIYVTFNGRSAGAGELEIFQALCKTYGIRLIEDNAQSLGSRRNDNKFISCPAGGIGSFSFSMPKIITTGQGGCLVTNDDYYGERIKRLKDFGRSGGGTDIHDEFGINSKFTEIQAIMGLNQIQTLGERIASKKAIFRLYEECLVAHCADHLRFVPTNLTEVTPWFADIFCTRRGELIEYLKNRGIETRPMYPYLSQQKVNNIEKRTNYYGDMEGLWLPSSINLSQIKIKQICNRIRGFYEQ